MELEWGDNIERNADEEEEVVEVVDEAENDSPVAEEDLLAREGRNCRPPMWTAYYIFGESLSEEDEENMALMMSSDPTSFEEAVKSLKWRLTMDEEIKSIERNQTWHLVELPTGAKKIGVKWIYKTKLNELGEVNK